MDNESDRRQKRLAPSHEQDLQEHPSKRVRDSTREQHVYLALSDEHGEKDERGDNFESSSQQRAVQRELSDKRACVASPTASTHNTNAQVQKNLRCLPGNVTDSEGAKAAEHDQAVAWSAPVSWRPYGRYRRQPGAEPLGEGGFATVHRVLDLLGGPARARKRLHFEGRPSKLQLSEIKVLTALQCHSSIVQLLDVCYTTSKIDIIMPIYQDSLFDLLQDSGGRELRFGRARELTRQLIEAVSHVHKQGFVHLDIKPGNIMIAEDGRLKLGDFGLAVRVGSSREVETLGTYGYAAPECLLGSRRPTFANDVWSTGCVVAEMFTGQPLFAFDTAANALQDILRFIGHPGGPVLPRHSFSNPDDDVPITWKAYQADASSRLADVVPQAAAIIIEMLMLQPNRRPHLATFKQHCLFTFKPPTICTDEERA
ncbi:hypothetical protein A4X13_0g7349 [Tilletia indica]|uniref:Protein kinase domain-containing protein n=1 Tax=Tilletia indica TaxID=43049 RepID=A0A8T8SKC8_9BASI|nr:hypothetical protein A4X13_0g7349 [Tilletia indica]